MFYIYSVNFNSDTNFSMVKEKYSPIKTVQLCLMEKCFMLLQFLNVNLNEVKLAKINYISQSAVAPSEVLSIHMWLLVSVSNSTALEGEIHKNGEQSLSSAGGD